MASSLHSSRPISISLSATEPLSYLSFGEAFQRAQEAYLPYYSVVRVQSGNEGERYYHEYDAIYFDVYCRNCQGPLIDPCTKRPIQKVHYFAMKCFKWNEELICQPVNLKTDTLCIIPVKTKKFKSLLLDSTNANVFVPGKEQAQYNVRAIQSLVANHIKKRKIFRNLPPAKKQQEVMLWLWCSSHGSYQGLIQLVKRCLQTYPKAKKLALELLLKRLTPPPAKENLLSAERSAVEKGFGLLTRYSKESREKMQENESKES